MPTVDRGAANRVRSIVAHSHEVAVNLVLLMVKSDSQLVRLQRCPTTMKKTTTCLMKTKFDNQTPSYWVAATEDNSPAIDAILNHRLRADIGEQPLHPGRDDFEYYVKWQGKAHIHATWANNSMLAACRGIRTARKLLPQSRAGGHPHDE